LTRYCAKKKAKAQTYPIWFGPRSPSSPSRRSDCAGSTHATAANAHAPHTKPFMSDRKTLSVSPERSSIATMMKSPAIPHQSAPESGSDAVRLHSKLQQEKPRKSSAHRTPGSFAILPKGYRHPIEQNALKSRRK